MRVLKPQFNSKVDASICIHCDMICALYNGPNSYPCICPSNPDSSLLDKEEMHRCIRDDDKHSSKNSQPYHVSPECQIVEPECTQNTSSRNFNVEPVSTIDQPEFRDLIDKQCFVSIMEEGQL